MVNIEQLINKTEVELINVKKKIDLVSFFRLFIFGLFIVEIYRGLAKNILTEIIFGVTCFCLFLFLIFLLNDSIKRSVFLENIKKICFEIINEDAGNSENIFVNNDLNHPYSNDLDIIGNKSLYEKINRCQTNFGKDKLKFFLLNQILDRNAIIDRQNAVKELSGKLEWCVKFLANTKSINSKNTSFKNLEKWTFNYNNFRLNKKSIRFLLIAIPAINIVLVAFAIVIKSILFSSLLFLVPILLSFIINKIYGKVINEIIFTVDNKAYELKGYVPVFSLIEQEIFISSENIFFAKKIETKSKETASILIKKLSGLIDSFDNSKIQIFGDILNIMFLWKLQFAVRIENFICNNNNELPKWFDAIAEFEALICLGLFAFQNDEFHYPTCSESLMVIDAVNLSHPLIPKKDRVYNNFSTIQNNNVTIITGANMTGKSTFLRSIGINMILAMNGCPVCAESFSFYPISIFTSMRTSDSLSDGSSYFNAEIKRLKLLVEKLENNEPQFIILDEILKGTNSVDKLKGSELFLEKIIKMKTFNTCLIATHDLDLTKMENLYPNNIINYCFELHNNDGLLEPDYKLQIGVTKSMNAIELMRKNNIID